MTSLFTDQRDLSGLPWLKEPYSSYLMKRIVVVFSLRIVKHNDTTIFEQIDTFEEAQTSRPTID
tara:strand:+ start:314 stop:505 length:192 start_codon:yes stop_codon:yes gene_type:complete